MLKKILQYINPFHTVEVAMERNLAKAIVILNENDFLNHTNYEVYLIMNLAHAHAADKGDIDSAIAIFEFLKTPIMTEVHKNKDSYAKEYKRLY